MPVPAPAQKKAIVLQGGTFHLGNGQILQNGALRFEKGLITEIGAQVPTEGAEIINTDGQHVYPGFILTATTLGLNEIEALRQTRDYAETGELNPNVRALVAYNTDSELIPTIRNNGVLLAHVMPSSGLVSGLSSVMTLDGWNWEDAQHTPDVGLHLHWPPMYEQTGWWAEPGGIEKNEEREEILVQIEDLFRQARAYAKQTNPEPVNLKLEAMRDLFSGRRILFLHASYAKEMVEAIALAQRHEVKKIVVIGGADALVIADFLKNNQIPVILDRLHRLPDWPEDPVWHPYELPALLHQAGVKVALAYDVESNAPMGTRNLPFLAGTAAAYGLDREVALQMITSYPAQILGIAEKTGTLEKGKEASLVVSKGDLLDMRTNQVQMAFIQGRKLDLNDKHKGLYQLYKEKYTRQKK
ncbi:MAG: amidohydrolase [Microscillaceae bacterium]